jgi:hypothetical protein
MFEKYKNSSGGKSMHLMDNLIDVAKLNHSYLMLNNFECFGCLMI